MRVRVVVGAIVGLSLATSPVLACKGNKLFSDDFSDVQISKDAWRLPDRATILQGYMELKAPPKRVVGAAIPVSVRSSEFEVCADIISPQARQENGTWGAFAFWFKNGQAYTYVSMSPNGSLGPGRRMDDGRNFPLGTVRTYDAINKGSGARNSLRLAIKGNVGIVYANEQRLTSFRGYPADATGSILLIGQSEPDGENAWRFTNIKLTESPK